MSAEVSENATEVLSAARRAIQEAKRAEAKAKLNLTSEEFKRDRGRQVRRTLSGYKEVTVDYDIEPEDLESLGYHHEDDCDSEPGEPGDGIENRHALLDWHDKAHGLNNWQTCPHEPCNLLSLTYRETP